MTESRNDRPDATAAANPILAATQMMLDQIRALTEVATAAGTRALGSVGLPGNDAAGKVLAYLQTLATQAPAPTVQLDLFLQELGAKRAIITAVQEQLAAFAQQLDILEESLKPLQQWGQNWATVQGSLTDAVQAFRLPGAPESVARPDSAR